MPIALILVAGLTPVVVSLIASWRFRRQFQQNIHIAADFAAQERLRQFHIKPRNPDAHYVDGMGLVIGDITCGLNAKSPFLRCTANPYGPCEGCREYEEKEYEPLLIE